MAEEIIRTAFPGIAASQIGERVAVTQASGLGRGVVPVATNGVRPFGLSAAAASVPGAPVTVRDRDNYVKAIAGASVGVGADVGVASTNGALGPVTGASGAVVWSIGQTVEPAQPGEYFVFCVNPRQLSGLS